MKHVQGKLAIHCLQRLGIEKKALEIDLDKVVSLSQLKDISSHEYEEYWREWQGRETEFYIKCFETLKETSTPELKQLLKNVFKERLPSLIKLRAAFLNETSKC